jgi:hypothetical protein
MFTYERPLIRYSDYGGLVGISIVKNNWIHLTALTGISVNNGVKRGDLDSVVIVNLLGREERYDKIDFHTFGCPIQLNIHFIKNKYIGFAGTLHANINNELPTIGIYLSLITGKLK